jgi:membrane-associated phospholipid phosphatase
MEANAHYVRGMADIDRQDGRDLLTRVVAPGIVLWGAIVGIGLLLTGPLVWLSRDEESVSKDLAQHRTSMWNSITMVWSRIGNTETVIGVCVVVVAIMVWRTRDWRRSVVPAIAIALQATVFVIAANMIGRTRPLVPKLDPAPPTSSYPSGHVGASTALYLTFAILATRIKHAWLRGITIVVCLLIPFLVSYARLYRGMHHVTDVAVGMVNGIVCALLAYGWYQRRSKARAAG